MAKSFETSIKNEQRNDKKKILKTQKEKAEQIFSILQEMKNSLTKLENILFSETKRKIPSILSILKNSKNLLFEINIQEEIKAQTGEKKEEEIRYASILTLLFDALSPGERTRIYRKGFQAARDAVAKSGSLTGATIETIIEELLTEEGTEFVKGIEKMKARMQSPEDPYFYLAFSKLDLVNSMDALITALNILRDNSPIFITSHSDLMESTENYTLPAMLFNLQGPLGNKLFGIRSLYAFRDEENETLEKLVKFIGEEKSNFVRPRTLIDQFVIWAEQKRAQSNEDVLRASVLGILNPKELAKLENIYLSPIKNKKSLLEQRIEDVGTLSEEIQNDLMEQPTYIEMEFPIAAVLGKNGINIPDDILRDINQLDLKDKSNLQKLQMIQQVFQNKKYNFNISNPYEILIEQLKKNIDEVEKAINNSKRTEREKQILENIKTQMEQELQLLIVEDTEFKQRNIAIFISTIMNIFIKATSYDPDKVKEYLRTETIPIIKIRVPISSGLSLFYNPMLILSHHIARNTRFSLGTTTVLGTEFIPTTKISGIGLNRTQTQVEIPVYSYQNAGALFNLMRKTINQIFSLEIMKQRKEIYEMLEKFKKPKTPLTLLDFIVNTRESKLMIIDPFKYFLEYVDLYIEDFETQTNPLGLRDYIDEKIKSGVDEKEIYKSIKNEVEIFYKEMKKRKIPAYLFAKFIRRKLFETDSTGKRRIETLLEDVDTNPEKMEKVREIIRKPIFSQDVLSFLGITEGTEELKLFFTLIAKINMKYKEVVDFINEKTGKKYKNISEIDEKDFILLLDNQSGLLPFVEEILSIPERDGVAGFMLNIRSMNLEDSKNRYFARSAVDYQNTPIEERKLSQKWHMVTFGGRVRRINQNGIAQVYYQENVQDPSAPIKTIKEEEIEPILKEAQEKLNGLFISLFEQLSPTKVLTESFIRKLDILIELRDEANRSTTTQREIKEALEKMSQKLVEQERTVFFTILGYRKDQNGNFVYTPAEDQDERIQLAFDFLELIAKMPHDEAVRKLIEENEKVNVLGETEIKELQKLVTLSKSFIEFLKSEKFQTVKAAIASLSQNATIGNLTSSVLTNPIQKITEETTRYYYGEKIREFQPQKKTEQRKTLGLHTLQGNTKFNQAIYNRSFTVAPGFTYIKNIPGTNRNGYASPREYKRDTRKEKVLVFTANPREINTKLESYSLDQNKNLQVTQNDIALPEINVYIATSQYSPVSGRESVQIVSSMTKNPIRVIPVVMIEEHPVAQMPIREPIAKLAREISLGTNTLTKQSFQRDDNYKKYQLSDLDKMPGFVIFEKVAINSQLATRFENPQNEYERKDQNIRNRINDMMMRFLKNAKVRELIWEAETKGSEEEIELIYSYLLSTIALLRDTGNYLINLHETIRRKYPDQRVLKEKLDEFNQFEKTIYTLLEKTIFESIPSFEPQKKTKQITRKGQNLGFGPVEVNQQPPTTTTQTASPWSVSLSLGASVLLSNQRTELKKISEEMSLAQTKRTQEITSNYGNKIQPIIYHKPPGAGKTREIVGTLILQLIQDITDSVVIVNGTEINLDPTKINRPILALLHVRHLRKQERQYLPFPTLEFIHDAVFFLAEIANITINHIRKNYKEQYTKEHAMIALSMVQLAKKLAGKNILHQNPKPSSVQDARKMLEEEITGYEFDFNLIITTRKDNISAITISTGIKDLSDGTTHKFHIQTDLAVNSNPNQVVISQSSSITKEQDGTIILNVPKIILAPKEHVIQANQPATKTQNYPGIHIGYTPTLVIIDEYDDTSSITVFNKPTKNEKQNKMSLAKGLSFPYDFQNPEPVKVVYISATTNKSQTMENTIDEEIKDSYKQDGMSVITIIDEHIPLRKSLEANKINRTFVVPSFQHQKTKEINEFFNELENHISNKDTNAKEYIRSTQRAVKTILFTAEQPIQPSTVIITMPTTSAYAFRVKNKENFEEFMKKYNDLKDLIIVVEDENGNVVIVPEIKVIAMKIEGILKQTSILEPARTLEGSVVRGEESKTVLGNINEDTEFLSAGNKSSLKSIYQTYRANLRPQKHDYNRMPNEVERNNPQYGPIIFTTTSFAIGGNFMPIQVMPTDTVIAINVGEGNEEQQARNILQLGGRLFRGTRIPNNVRIILNDESEKAKMNKLAKFMQGHPIYGRAEYDAYKKIFDPDTMLRKTHLTSKKPTLPILGAIEESMRWAKVLNYNHLSEWISQPIRVRKALTKRSNTAKIAEFFGNILAIFGKPKRPTQPFDTWSQETMPFGISLYDPIIQRLIKEIKENKQVTIRTKEDLYRVLLAIYQDPFLAQRTVLQLEAFANFIKARTINQVLTDFEGSKISEHAVSFIKAIDPFALIGYYLGGLVLVRPETASQTERQGLYGFAAGRPEDRNIVAEIGFEDQFEEFIKAVAEKYTKSEMTEEEKAKERALVRSVLENFREMGARSLRIIKDGTETKVERKRIYINGTLAQQQTLIHEMFHMLQDIIPNEAIEYMWINYLYEEIRPILKEINEYEENQETIHQIAYRALALIFNPKENMVDQNGYTDWTKVRDRIRKELSGFITPGTEKSVRQLVLKTTNKLREKLDGITVFRNTLHNYYYTRFLEIWERYFTLKLAFRANLPIATTFDPIEIKRLETIFGIDVHPDLRSFYNKLFGKAHSKVRNIMRQYKNLIEELVEDIEITNPEESEILFDLITGDIYTETIPFKKLLGPFLNLPAVEEVEEESKGDSGRRRQKRTSPPAAPELPNFYAGELFMHGIRLAHAEEILGRIFATYPALERRIFPTLQYWAPLTFFQPAGTYIIGRPMILGGFSSSLRKLIEDINEQTKGNKNPNQTFPNLIDHLKKNLIFLLGDFSSGGLSEAKEISFRRQTEGMYIRMLSLTQDFERLTMFTLEYRTDEGEKLALATQQAQNYLFHIVANELPDVKSFLLYFLLEIIKQSGKKNRKGDAFVFEIYLPFSKKKIDVEITEEQKREIYKRFKEIDNHLKRTKSKFLIFESSIGDYPPITKDAENLRVFLEQKIAERTKTTTETELEETLDFLLEEDLPYIPNLMEHALLEAFDRNIYYDETNREIPFFSERGFFIKEGYKTNQARKKRATQLIQSLRDLFQEWIVFQNIIGANTDESSENRAMLMLQLFKNLGEIIIDTEENFQRKIDEILEDKTIPDEEKAKRILIVIEEYERIKQSLLNHIEYEGETLQVLFPGEGEKLDVYPIEEIETEDMIPDFKRETKTTASNGQKDEIVSFEYKTPIVSKPTPTITRPKLLVLIDKTEKKNEVHQSGIALPYTEDTQDQAEMILRFYQKLIELAIVYKKAKTEGYTPEINQKIKQNLRSIIRFMRNYADTYKNNGGIEYTLPNGETIKLTNKPITNKIIEEVVNKNQTNRINKIQTKEDVDSFLRDLFSKFFLEIDVAISDKKKHETLLQNATETILESLSEIYSEETEFTTISTEETVMTTESILKRGFIFKTQEDGQTIQVPFIDPSTGNVKEINTVVGLTIKREEKIKPTNYGTEITVNVTGFATPILTRKVTSIGEIAGDSTFKAEKQRLKAVIEKRETTPLTEIVPKIKATVSSNREAIEEKIRRLRRQREENIRTEKYYGKYVDQLWVHHIFDTQYAVRLQIGSTLSDFIVVDVVYSDEPEKQKKKLALRDEKRKSKIVSNYLESRTLPYFRSKRDAKRWINQITNLSPRMKERIKISYIEEGKTVEKSLREIEEDLINKGEIKSLKDLFVIKYDPIELSASKGETSAVSSLPSRKVRPIIRSPGIITKGFSFRKEIGNLGRFQRRAPWLNKRYNYFGYELRLIEIFKNVRDISAREYAVNDMGARIGAQIFLSKMLHLILKGGIKAKTELTFSEGLDLILDRIEMFWLRIKRLPIGLEKRLLQHPLGRIVLNTMSIMKNFAYQVSFSFPRAIPLHTIASLLDSLGISVPINWLMGLMNWINENSTLGKEILRLFLIMPIRIKGMWIAQPYKAVFYNLLDSIYAIVYGQLVSGMLALLYAIHTMNYALASTILGALTQSILIFVLFIKEYIKELFELAMNPEDVIELHKLIAGWSSSLAIALTNMFGLIENPQVLLTIASGAAITPYLVSNKNRNVFITSYQKAINDANELSASLMHNAFEKYKVSPNIWNRFRYEFWRLLLGETVMFELTKAGGGLVEQTSIDAQLGNSDYTVSSHALKATGFFTGLLYGIEIYSRFRTKDKNNKNPYIELLKKDFLDLKNKIMNDPKMTTKEKAEAIYDILYHLSLYFTPSVKIELDENGEPIAQKIGNYGRVENIMKKVEEAKNEKTEEERRIKILEEINEDINDFFYNILEDSIQFGRSLIIPIFDRKKNQYVEIRYIDYLRERLPGMLKFMIAKAKKHYKKITGQEPTEKELEEILSIMATMAYKFSVVMEPVGNDWRTPLMATHLIGPQLNSFFAAFTTYMFNIQARMLSWLWIANPKIIYGARNILSFKQRMTYAASFAKLALILSLLFGIKGAVYRIVPFAGMVAQVSQPFSAAIDKIDENIEADMKTWDPRDGRYIGPLAEELGIKMYPINAPFVLIPVDFVQIDLNPSIVLTGITDLLTGNIRKNELESPIQDPINLVALSITRTTTRNALEFFPNIYQTANALETIKNDPAFFTMTPEEAKIQTGRLNHKYLSPRANLFGNYASDLLVATGRIPFINGYVATLPSNVPVVIARAIGGTSFTSEREFAEKYGKELEKARRVKITPILTSTAGITTPYNIKPSFGLSHHSKLGTLITPISIMEHLNQLTEQVAKSYASSIYPNSYGLVKPIEKGIEETPTEIIGSISITKNDSGISIETNSNTINKENFVNDMYKKHSRFFTEEFKPGSPLFDQLIKPLLDNNIFDQVYITIDPYEKDSIKIEVTLSTEFLTRAQERIEKITGFSPDYEMLGSLLGFDRRKQTIQYVIGTENEIDVKKIVGLPEAIAKRILFWNALGIIPKEKMPEILRFDWNARYKEEINKELMPFEDLFLSLYILGGTESVRIFTDNPTEFQTLFQKTMRNLYSYASKLNYRDDFLFVTLGNSDIRYFLREIENKEQKTDKVVKGILNVIIMRADRYQEPKP